MTEWEKFSLKIEADDWRELAASIAVTVLLLLKQRDMTKQQLAERMGVKPQYISRVVKGKANLTLDTIAKLEKALGEQIISVSDPSACTAVNPVHFSSDAQWNVFFHGASEKPVIIYAKRLPKFQFPAMAENYVINS